MAGVTHNRARKSAPSLAINVGVDGIQQTLAAFKQLPKDASNELRNATLVLAKLLADAASEAGRAEGRQAALAAPTVVARRDRIPIVVVGGTKRVGRRRVPVYKILFGSEFGSSRLKQYKPHRGREGYWFFPTVEREAQATADVWGRMAEAIIAKWSEG